MTAADVAAWMVEELARVKWLYQEQVVWDIERQFGKEFTTTNQAGNVVIHPSVLRCFRRLTGDEVVWERGERLWRRRAAYDAPSRLQD